MSERWNPEASQASSGPCLSLGDLPRSDAECSPSKGSVIGPKGVVTADKAISHNLVHRGRAS
jgi:hypothetical protein